MQRKEIRTLNFQELLRVFSYFISFCNICPGNIHFTSKNVNRAKIIIFLGEECERIMSEQQEESNEQCATR